MQGLTRRITWGSNSPVSSFFSLIQRATSSHLANSKQCPLVHQLYMPSTTSSDFSNFHHKTFPQSVPNSIMSVCLHHTAGNVPIAPQWLDLKGWSWWSALTLCFYDQFILLHIIAYFVQEIPYISYLSVSSCSSISFFNNLLTSLFVKFDTRSAESITVSSSSLAAQINLHYSAL